MAEGGNAERPTKIRLIRLNAVAQGFAAGSLVGLGVFVATAWLLIKGGEDVGSHLSLLGHYFIGYSVTWPGSVIGLLWGFAVGFAAGYLVSATYNRIIAGRP